MASTEAGMWLQDTLLNHPDLQFDHDVIARLVSYCERAQPQDAKEFLANIVGAHIIDGFIDEYLQRRSSINLNLTQIAKEGMTTYVKPSTDTLYMSSGNRKSKGNDKNITVTSKESKPSSSIPEAADESLKGKATSSKKKKGGKSVTLAEVANGSVVFKQGQPCDCQARKHNLVANCLSCGKIICEQTGEGPCTFCGVLVLREGSNYAGLDNVTFSRSENEAKAEAFKDRLVDYDRNAAQRTTIIDDQSDYYEIEGNSWLSQEEKMLLKKKQEEIEEDERARRNKLIVTFDLLGRKVVMTEHEAAETDGQAGILCATSNYKDESSNSIIGNPSIRDQPVFVEPRSSRNAKLSHNVKQQDRFQNGICLRRTGRVQNEEVSLDGINQLRDSNISSDDSWNEQAVRMNYNNFEDLYTEC